MLLQYGADDTAIVGNGNTISVRIEGIDKWGNEYYSKMEKVYVALVCGYYIYIVIG